MSSLLIGALAVVIIGLLLFVWWLIVLIEAIRVPADRWQASGQSQLVYVLLMVFLGILGTLLYVVIARPKLV